MSQRGFALVTVVLLMLGLAVLATALGFAAAQQVAVRASLHDLARARAAADAGARAAVDDWNAARRSLDPVGRTVLLGSVDLEPGLRVSSSARRLSRTTWLVQTEGVVVRGSLPPITRHARRLLRGLDADSVGATYDAAIIAGRVRIDGGAHVRSDTPAAPVDDDLCRHWPTTGAALRAPAESTSVSPASFVTGSPVILNDPDPSRFRDRLGILDRAALVEAGTPVVDERVTPTAAQLAESCDRAAPYNWGAAEGPCATHQVLVHAAAPLTVDGGYGQGVIVASGDLVLDGGFVFRGLIIAAGNVIVRDADVRGAIAGGFVDIGSRARVSFDRCAIAAALAHTPPLGRAIVPPRSWLPTFD